MCFVHCQINNHPLRLIHVVNRTVFGARCTLHAVLFLWNFLRNQSVQHTVIFQKDNFFRYFSKLKTLSLRSFINIITPTIARDYPVFTCSVLRSLIACEFNCSCNDYTTWRKPGYILHSRDSIVTPRSC